MAYEKTVWQSGDLITAERMNKIEQRLEEKINNVSGEIFEIEVINVDPPSSPDLIYEKRLSKTWQEIYDAFIAGKTLTSFDNPPIVLRQFYRESVGHMVYFVNNFNCLSPNDYPTIKAS